MNSRPCALHRLLPEKGNKYGAKKTGTHASQKEHNRANRLKLMQRAGLISNLREQVSFELIPAQYEKTSGKDSAEGASPKSRIIERHAATLRISYIPTTRLGRQS